MARVKVPYIEETYDSNNNLQSVRKDMILEIDASIYANLKWETHFQEQLKVDLPTYTERIVKMLDKPDQLKANLLSALKLLYCYVDSSSLPTFADFCKLLKYSVADEIINSICTVLNEVTLRASKN